MRHLIVQVLGSVAVLAGVYGLAGQWWTLLIGGVVVLGVSVLAEASPRKGTV